MTVRAVRRFGCFVPLLSFGLLACGGGTDSTNFPPASDASASDGSSPAVDGSSPPAPDAGQTRDSSPPPTPDSGTKDAGQQGVDSGSCDTPTGGYPCDPGSIECNNAPCPTSTSYCCATTPTATCNLNAQSCTAAELHCDEQSDCPGSQICCFILSGSTGNTQCMNSCPSGTFNFQICRTNSECGPGKSCIVQTCQGRQIEACENIPGCT